MRALLDQSTQPNPVVLVGLFVSSLDEENATCLPAFFVGPGLDAFSAMTVSLFPDFDDGNAAAFIFASENRLYVLPATAGGFRFGGAGFFIWTLYVYILCPCIFKARR